MKVLYTTAATAKGGRDGGTVATDDGRLTAELELPPALGGKGGPGTNPEQLFAAGYAACFLTAFFTASKGAPEVADATLTAQVSIGTSPQGDFDLAVVLDLDPGTADAALASGLMRQAHAMCPYSRATSGNIEVVLKVRGEGLAA